MPSSKQGEAPNVSRWEGGRVNAALTWFVPLFRQLLRGRPQTLEPLMDLTCLPIGYAVFLLLIAGCFPLLWLRVYALLAVTVIGGHVLAAAWSGTDFAGDMRILARAPGYILWKLCMMPSLLRSSRPEAAWVRTERQAAVQKVSLETAGDSMPAPAMEHALRQFIGGLMKQVVVPARLLFAGLLLAVIAPSAQDKRHGESISKRRSGAQAKSDERIAEI